MDELCRLRRREGYGVCFDECAVEAQSSFQKSPCFFERKIKKGGKAAFLYVLQQQPLSQPQPQLLPLPFQSTKMMTRTMIHHQLLPKAQIPEELLQDITKPPEI